MLRRKRELSAEAQSASRGVSLTALLIPKPGLQLFIRVLLVAAVAWCFFKWVCLPMYINGSSMEPAYPARGFNFCWAPAYWLSKPAQGDVVIARYAGVQYMLLKRVVALEGQTVEFRGGRLFVDGRELSEPYVKGPCDWSLPPRTVKPGHIYIVGDNRSMPLEGHVFGQLELSRVKGAPIW